ncbi:hypothetical protein D9753_34250 [Streptomyces dangxiongensis]|uniref:HAD family hydrolase n=1 Tax=Streptomyces dangxiongensis TaxID=1442032 RepID=A0A3G2JR51_9ACTN|nr:hypothetical protein [Streptomyces dangxiongensis]AYN43107.1 hypothetical protein D9753_34250 [Streptomyces dangxiongensis]
MLGLPAHVRACLFDLDGVLTRTAKVHAAASKERFDGRLRERATREGTAFVPFDAVDDHDEYVDGRPRADGVRTFDPVVAHERRLRGVPGPDTCLEAARGPGAEPDRAAVSADAPAGVEAGPAGRSGVVVGVDRVGRAERLRARGADVAVRDLAELLESR